MIDLIKFRVISFLILLFITVSFKFYFSNFLWENEDKYILITNSSYAFLITCLIINFIMIILKVFPKTSSSNFFSKISSREEFNIIMKETTKIEKQKLYSNPKFVKMLKEKGPDESKWNWQLKARIDGKMNNISDDELDEISLSDIE